MKRIIGLSVAGLLVLMQLAGLATRRAEPVMYLTPIAGAAAGHGHRA
jgi:hypothetical protein